MQLSECKGTTVGLVSTLEMDLLKHRCHFCLERGGDKKANLAPRVGLSWRVFGNVSHDVKIEPVVLVQSRPYQGPRVLGEVKRVRLWALPSMSC